MLKICYDTREKGAKLGSKCFLPNRILFEEIMREYFLRKGKDIGYADGKEM